MSWTEIINTSFGTLLGAAIALATIWIKEVFDRRRTIQTWYEDTYITKGIDHITLYTVEILYWLTSRNDELQSITKMPNLPLDGVVRVQIALQTEVFTMTIVVLRKHAKRALTQHEAEQLTKTVFYFANELRWWIDELRKEMLLIRIKRKSDIYKIAQRPMIKELLKQVEKSISTFESEFVNQVNKLNHPATDAGSQAADEVI